VRVERSTHVEAPPERLYQLVMNPSRLDEWVSIHKDLIDAPDGNLRKGSKLTQRLKLAGRTFKVEWTVVENEKDSLVVWEGKGPMGSHASVTYDFEEVDGGTDFSYANEFHLPGGPLGRMAEPAVRRVTGKELDKSLEQLKKLVEE
jgi:carbon monoxide dehydrogenase subunit G